jgi:hypothetical protein
MILIKKKRDNWNDVNFKRKREDTQVKREDGSEKKNKKKEQKGNTDQRIYIIELKWNGKRKQANKSKTRT